MVNAIYAYDNKSTGGVTLLEINHCNCMTDKKDEAVACTNKIHVHGVHLHERPSIIFPHKDNTQYIIADG